MLKEIQNKIYFIRGLRVMMDFDLAEMYGVETKRLNEQVLRNLERFPSDFMFQLENQDVMELRSQTATLVNKDYFKYKPRVFTENGIAMLSSVLKSSQAIQVNISIMRIFTSLRNWSESGKVLSDRMTKLEKENHKAFEILSTRLDSVEEAVFITPPAKKKRIGLN